VQLDSTLDSRGPRGEPNFPRTASSTGYRCSGALGQRFRDPRREPGFPERAYPGAGPFAFFTPQRLRASSSSVTPPKPPSPPRHLRPGQQLDNFGSPGISTNRPLSHPKRSLVLSHGSGRCCPEAVIAHRLRGSRFRETALSRNGACSTKLRVSNSRGWNRSSCGALRLEAASPSDFERPDRIGAAPSAADRRSMTLRRIMSKLGGL
jgi:hypothetical protein